MRLTTTLCIGILLLSVSANAADHRAEPLLEAPPSGEFSEAILKQISETGFKIIRGKSRTVCEIWPCTTWPVQEGFKPSNELLYPFKPGQLIGVIRFPRKGKDFRDQTMDKGVYVLRYALQPTDGNHEGTSPTRDFLVMTRPEDDQTPGPMEIKTLLTKSAEAAQSSHPAMLCLQKASGKQEPLSTRHNEENDWWIVRFVGKAGNTKKAEIAVDLIVAGHANE